MSGTQVTYLISGPAHLPYLVCSLHTLRQHYFGNVEVFSWPESVQYVERIAKDPRLGVVCHEREPVLRKRDGVGGNSQFIDKIRTTMGLAGSIGKDGVSLYLDADTTIHGNLMPLINTASNRGFVATQWNDWSTAGCKVRRRIKALLDVEGVPSFEVASALSYAWPSVNGGVWAAKPGSPVLPLWLEWTLACGSMFISDERVLHLMAPHFPEDVGIIGSNGIYNSSPIYRSKLIDDDDVVVWHYHGDCNVRPKKSMRAVELWWPIYQECLESNVGGLAEWRGEIHNRHLDKLEKELAA